MTKTFATLIVTCCILVGESATAQSPAERQSATIGKNTVSDKKIRVSIAPYISKGFGYTKWVMKQTGDLGGGTIGTVKSELDYPLNSLYGGFSLSIGRHTHARGDWQLKLTAGGNINDPSGVMKDHDWITIPGIIDDKISYTESSVEMRSFIASVEFQTLVRQGVRRGFGLLAGVRLQRISQDLYDLDGWQLDDQLERVHFSAYQDTLVGTYEINYTLPYFGAFFRISSTPAFSASLRGAFALAIVSDDDDHVLRYRRATASGTGTGFVGGFDYRMATTRQSSAIKPFVELNGDLIYVSASPSQTIRWYGDDPITPDPLDDETGLVMSGIPHKITSLQGYITLRVGLMF